MTFESFRSPKARFGARLPDGSEAVFEESKWLEAYKLQRDAAKSSPVLFFHGYNNDQAKAFERARIIAFLIGFDRPVIAVTWPSYGQFKHYRWDEANNDWANYIVQEVVGTLAAADHPVDIVAHSMGSRLALNIATREARLPKQQRNVGRLILASPDVDRDTMAAWLASKTRQEDFFVSIYGSTRDQALSESWRLHGYPRAGDLSAWVTGNIAKFPYEGRGFAVIDTSDVPTGMLGHSAFIETRQGMADLCRVLTSGDVGVGRTPDNVKHLGYSRLLKNEADDDCAKRAKTILPSKRAPSP